MNTKPRTKAGRAMLKNERVHMFDCADMNGCSVCDCRGRADILAIEAEARDELLTTLESEVAGLETPDWFPFNQPDILWRVTVLALLSKHRDSTKG